MTKGYGSSDDGRTVSSEGGAARDTSAGRTGYPSDDSPKPFSRRRRVGVRSDLTLVKGILAKALAFKGIDKKVERYEFILYWKEIVGEKIAAVTKPEYISRRALIVTVTHSAWAQELNFMKPVILQKLAHYLKKGDIVNDIVFRVGSR